MSTNPVLRKEIAVAILPESPESLLRLPCATRIATVEGDELVLTQRIGVEIDDGSAGRATEVVLTADGRGKLDGWHEGTESSWIRFERHSAYGRVSHGFIDSVSRRLLQAG